MAKGSAADAVPPTTFSFWLTDLLTVDTSTQVQSSPRTRTLGIAAVGLLLVRCPSVTAGALYATDTSEHFSICLSRFIEQMTCPQNRVQAPRHIAKKPTRFYLVNPPQIWSN